MITQWDIATQDMVWDTVWNITVQDVVWDMWFGMWFEILFYTVQDTVWDIAAWDYGQQLMEWREDLPDC